MAITERTIVSLVNFWVLVPAHVKVVKHLIEKNAMQGKIGIAKERLLVYFQTVCGQIPLHNVNIL